MPLPVYAARDLRTLCRAMGVPVTFGGTSTYADGEPVMGLVDDGMQIKLAESGIGGVEANLPQLRLPYNAFSPMPVSGQAVSVAGTAYTVNEPTAEDDGAFLVYELMEV